VISALIAVLAAGIAFAGVVKTTGSARREARRKERLEVLERGFKVVFDFYQ
jgi:hypothetical protein